MSEYTPTMDEVRAAYKAGGGWWPERGEQFDRAIAAHDTAIREKMAQDIEAHIDDDGTDEWFAAIDLAAQIARGEVSQ